jgi:hypothetical protein
MNEGLFEQSKKGKLTTIHDIGSHVKSHRQHRKTNSHQKEAQPRDFVQIFRVQKQKRNSEYNSEFFKNDSYQQGPNKNQCKIFPQVKQKQLDRKTVQNFLSHSRGLGIIYGFSSIHPICKKSSN